MAAKQSSFVTGSGEEVTMRLMMRTDEEALLDFFRRVPEEDRFFLKVVDAQVEFTRDASGKVTGAILHQGGRSMPAPRK